MREARPSGGPGPARTLAHTLDVSGPLAQVLATSDGAESASFLYGQGRLAAFGPTETRFVAADVRQSPRLLTDERGQVAGARGFDAWGVPDPGRSAANATGPAALAELFGFTGERQDARSGLLYLRARWYDPGLGRFLSRDPVSGARTDPRTQHPYMYGLDNPASFVDRTGRSASGLFDGATGYAYDGRAFYGEPSARPTPTPQPGPRPSALPAPSPDVHLPSADEVLESSVGPAAIGIAGLAAAGEARAEHLLRRGLAEALRLRQLAAAPDPRLLLRLPIVREVRSTGLRLQADVRELATRVGAGSLQLLYRISATAGGVLTASHAAGEQLHEDAHRRDLSVDARLARAAFRGIVTGGTSAVAGVAAGVFCAPATLTLVGVAVTAGCAVGGAAAGEFLGSQAAKFILSTIDPRFGL